ncbi:hypothetical protein HP567_010685 [Brevibacillus sp. M2.1A]|uniref:hypothetical protein n=1 Tax=Brevibacillus sp. M2.1A TaxID=2738980 RepID=UPI00156BADB0|nr:hypothetical protein [Brevibacillus sp. M2.1A]MCC8435007.1 hypothetical protein [Brevibacillus sp. M2.1A]
MSSHLFQHSAQASTMQQPVQKNMPPPSASLKHDSPSHLIQLQKSIGNRALIQLMKSKRQGIAHNKQPIQRFKDEDEYNTKRRVNAETARSEAFQNDEMQMDHTISQHSLITFSELLGEIQQLPNKTFKAAKQSYATLINEIKMVSDNEEKCTRIQLVNFYKNLVPGFNVTTGNPGSKFDPQIEMADMEDESTNIAREKAVSAKLREIDSYIRKLYHLTPLFPNTKKDEDLAKQMDEVLSKVMNDITTCLKKVREDFSEEPSYDETIWYKSETKNVKRVPAEWLKTGAGKLENLGSKQHLLGYEKDKTAKSNTQDAQDSFKEVTFTWDYQLTEFDKKIKVNVVISEKCWKHIYARHKLEYFAGDVQAINTFWKDDPHEKITQELLEPEINLLIERSKLQLRVLQEGDKDPINETAHHLFFQGKMEVVEEVQNIAEPVANSQPVNKSRNKKRNQQKKVPKPPIKSIHITLESVAPESPELAYAVEPTLLQNEYHHKRGLQRLFPPKQGSKRVEEK